jgi:DNA repair exonuclease SbcCD ATPase subunit
MIEKLNRVFEKLPPEHRDIMREAFTILIEEVINAVVKDNERIWQSIEKTWRAMNERFERQERDNERIWQTIEKVWQAIEKLEKTMKEGFERQEKENERIWQNIERIWQAMNERFERQAQENEKIWQAIKEGFERQEKENQRIWQAIEELRKDMKEGFERQEKENKKIWQNIERIWQSIEKLENTMKEGFEKQAQENEKIWQAIKEGFERQEKENQRIWQAIEELRKDMKEGFEKQAKENERIWQAIEKTNERLDKLILAFEKAEKRNEQTRKQVGVLTDNFGYLLEDRAIRTLPKLLKERYGFEITEPLRRDFIEINGKYIEVNIYGKARKNDEEFIIIGEAKTRITNKAIIGFLEKCNNFEGKQFRIMIGYLITPKIKQILENNNIIFINSYELEL